MLTKLETYIKSYLRNESPEVALEELGGFRAKQSEPVISRTGEELIPQRTMVSFDAGTQPTDLHFVEFCAKKEEVSTAEAEGWIKSEIERVFDHMNHGKPWVIYGVGKFLLDGHNDLIYVPMVDQDLMADDEDPAIKQAREEQARLEAEAAARLADEEAEKRAAANAAALSSGTYASFKSDSNSPKGTESEGSVLGGSAHAAASASGAPKPPVVEKKGEIKTKQSKEEAKKKAKEEEQPKKKKRRWLVPILVILLLLLGSGGGYYYMVSQGHLTDMFGIMDMIGGGHHEEEESEEEAAKKAEEQRIADSLATAQAIADSLALEEEKVREQLAKLLENEKPKSPTKVSSKKRAPKKRIDKDTGVEIDTNYLNVKVPEDVMARSQGTVVTVNNFNVPITARQAGIKSVNDKYAKYQVITCELPNVEEAVLCSEAYAKKGFSTFVTDFSQGTFKVSIARSNDRGEAERMAKILREKLGTRVEILELAGE